MTRPNSDPSGREIYHIKHRICKLFHVEQNYCTAHHGLRQAMLVISDPRRRRTMSRHLLDWEGNVPRGTKRELRHRLSLELDVNERGPPLYWAAATKTNTNRAARFVSSHFSFMQMSLFDRSANEDKSAL